jgi:hypothetical protein
MVLILGRDGRHRIHPYMHGQGHTLLAANIKSTGQHSFTLMVSMVGSRCLLSEALTMISSKILYKPGTCLYMYIHMCVTWHLIEGGPRGVLEG